MKKIILSVTTVICALTSCISGNSNKGIPKLDDENSDSLVLYKDSFRFANNPKDISHEGIDSIKSISEKKNMVRVISTGSQGYCDTLVYEKDVERIQEEHHMKYKGPFHSRSVKNGISTHYSCTHSSHASHYSSFNPNRN